MEDKKASIFEHTTGPWYPINYAGYWNIQSENFYEGPNLLDEDKFPNAEANAKLCAAAPDLLAASISAKNQIQHLHDMMVEDGFTPISTIDVMNEINEALNKAKGI